VVQAEDFRLSLDGYAAFWSSFAHVVRNVVDHGFETAAERRAAGKPEANQVVLAATVSRGNLTIEIADDGRGIAWEKLARKAERAGLAHGNRAELIEALFHPGISTAETLTETSGRGVGMSAVAEACMVLGGSCRAQSETGKGTRFTFVLPLREG
jgi:two-component system chemotaxis sensor kinase CheA